MPKHKLILGYEETADYPEEFRRESCHWSARYRAWLRDRPEIAKLGLTKSLEAYLKENLDG